MHWMLKPLIIFSFIVVAGAQLAPSLAVAKTSTHADAAKKITVAGRQRMLSQRLTAAVCLVMAGVDVAHRNNVAQASWKEFDAAVVGLAKGSEDIGVTPEINTDILAAIDGVSDIWKIVAPSLRQILAGDVSNYTISAVLNENMTLLSTSNDVVQAFLRQYGKEAINQNLALTLDMAGRQRMLSQKMMKEACFIAVGLDADEMRISLQHSVDLFEASLGQLSHGASDVGIIAPPSQALSSQLETVKKLWVEYRKDLTEVANSKGRVDLLKDLGTQSDAVLAAAHKAVQMYTE